jgi:tetratricopeptide (TPR) repeat protein
MDRTAETPKCGNSIKRTVQAFSVLGLVILTGISSGIVESLYAEELSWQDNIEAVETAQEAGRISEAETMFQKAIASLEKANQYAPDIAEVYSKLGKLYRAQKEYGKARDAFKREVFILEWCYGPDSVEVVSALNYLANAYYHLDGERPISIALYRHVLVIREKTLGADHPDVAESLDALGIALDFPYARLPESIPLFQRALTIREKAFGPDNLTVAVSLSTLAFVYDLHGQYDKAEPYYLRALSIREKNLGPDAPEVMQTVYNLGVLYSLMGQYDKAEAFNKRRISSLEKTLGADHPDVASALGSYASLLSNMGREEEAIKVRARADQIKDQQ